MVQLTEASKVLNDARIEEIARAAAREVVEEAQFEKDMLVHTIVELHGTPGIVVDEATAKATPCRCFHYDTKDYCFSKGIIGMLDPSQKEIYCTSKEYDTIKPGIKERFSKFREAAKAAHKKIETLPKGERLIPWLEAMGKELRERGIEIS